MAKMAEYKVLPLSVSTKEAFTEASKEELRVLLAIIESEGKNIDAESLSVIAHTSKARCMSALVLWEEAGVIEKCNMDIPTITEEFEERLRLGKIREEDSLNVAKSIRDNSLADMISECAVIMKRSSLSSAEIKDLTALHDQYALSEEFIVTLAAYLAEEGKLTVTKLVNKAIKLTEKEIDTPEYLTEYIAEKSKESEAEREFRKIFGIYGRAPSKSEKDYFIKWSKEYGYFTEIVGEAYDIAVNSVTRGYAKYADKLLSRWFETGCRTLSECRERYEEDKKEKSAGKYPADKEKSNSSTKKFVKYTNFDAEEAFRLALERSYGSDDDDDDD